MGEYFNNLWVQIRVLNFSDLQTQHLSLKYVKQMKEYLIKYNLFIPLPPSSPMAFQPSWAQASSLLRFREYTQIHHTR